MGFKCCPADEVVLADAYANEELSNTNDSALGVAEAVEYTFTVSLPTGWGTMDYYVEGMATIRGDTVVAERSVFTKARLTNVAGQSLTADAWCQIPESAAGSTKRITVPLMPTAVRTGIAATETVVICCRVVTGSAANMFIAEATLYAHKYRRS